MSSALRHLAWALPTLALLAGCNGGENAKPELHAVATYAPATWQDLPSVSDDDLLAGFQAWRNGCEKLKRDPVWAATCEAAARMPEDAAQIRAFLQQNLSVYGLRSAQNNAHGPITGYLCFGVAHAVEYVFFFHVFGQRKFAGRPPAERGVAAKLLARPFAVSVLK